jgi:acetyltransferase-like isoleucine patch superfamily enzyme
MINFGKRLVFLVLELLSTIYAKSRCGSYGEGFRVNMPCAFNSKTMIGTDCHFNGLRVVGNGPVRIGDHFHSGSENLIFTVNHNYSSPDSLPYDEQDIFKEVVIGKAVWFGTRIIVLPGTQIGDGVVVQAGAVVSGKIPDGAVIGGNPAKVIKYRDMDRFRELSSKGLYVSSRSVFSRFVGK